MSKHRKLPLIGYAIKNIIFKNINEFQRKINK